MEHNFLFAVEHVADILLNRDTIFSRDDATGALTYSSAGAPIDCHLTFALNIAGQASCQIKFSGQVNVELPSFQLQNPVQALGLLVIFNLLTPKI